MTKRKKKKSKFNPIILLFYLIGGVCGFSIAVLIDYLTKSGVSTPYALVFILIIALTSIFAIILIHESGHLVMGLLTGYDFISFRIGSFTFVKENNKLVTRKFNIAGTGGQCILTHTEVEKPEELPYFWYNFGGVFFNFLTALICLFVILLSKNPFVLTGFLIFAILSLAIGIINIIPTAAMGIGTDGYNIILMKKSPAVRITIYKTMLINALQFQGTRLEDMPENLLTFTDEEKQCEFGTALTCIEANLLMNRHDFKAAEEEYRSVAENNDTYTLYQNECRCEMIFCMIMNGCTAEEINEVYDNELKKYIITTGKTYIMRKRLMYAYYLIIEKDFTKAEEEYLNAEKMEKTYPAKGEYLSEMALIKYVKNNFVR